MITHHAPLAPSSAPQWGRCPGSVAANLSAPDISSERAREGTASHWVGAECLVAGGCCALWIGKTAPNGVVIDDEMAEGAQAWVDEVQATLASHGAPHGLEVEHRVTMPEVHKDNWGTLDSAIWIASANTLYVWDYKYGHREVNALENLQLVNYALGMVWYVGGHMQADTRIVMRVVQPFCYHAPEVVSEWVLSRDELMPYLKLLHNAANQAMTVPTMTAGVHCRDCAAIARCATAKRAAYSVLTYAGEPYDINTLAGPDLAAEREILTAGLIAVKARLEAVEDDLQARIAKGDRSSGLTVQAKEGRLGWNVPPEQAIALAGQFGADISKPGVVTPTQATKLIPNDMRAAFNGVLQSITSRPSTGMKLIPIDASKTARAFKNRS